MRARGAFAISLAMIAAACSRADAVSNGVATDDGIAAIALPEEQYRTMLKRSALGAQSGATFVGILGLEEGCELLDDTVNKVVKRNLPEWRANLIAAYRDNVPPDQLAEAVQKSPRRAHVMLQAYLPAIGDAMKRSSEPLLRRSGVEVLTAMGDVALKVDRASIDMQARERDLTRIKRSREICGVGPWQQQ